jgi:hypothetical protein
MPVGQYIRKSGDPKTRLLAKVVVTPNGCWEFNGFRLPNGYGRIYGIERDKVMLAHRLSWTVHMGPIPEGMCVCHTCDNRPCVRPDHLFLGTASDNMQDCSRKGRAFRHEVMPATRGEKHWSNKLTDAQVREIRSRRNEPRKRLAAEFGTSPKYVSSLICGTKRKYT